MKFKVRVKKEAYGDLIVDADDEQDAMNKADDILLAGDEPQSTWGEETAESHDAIKVHP